MLLARETRNWWLAAVARVSTSKGMQPLVPTQCRGMTYVIKNSNNLNCAVPRQHTERKGAVLLVMV
jgi:hypothetical protein